ncbi:hypothetical protein ACQEU3_20395 [Spirillospora sp. CA-253888]
MPPLFWRWVLSAAVAAMLATWRRGHRCAAAGFAVTTAILAYTGANIIERPTAWSARPYFALRSW